MNSEEPEEGSEVSNENEHEEISENTNDPSSEENIAEGPNENIHTSFLPVYRVRMKFHTVPLLISILIAGVLAWYIVSFTNFETVIPEASPTQGLWNGLIYTAFAVVSSLVIYFLVKKKGLNVLKIIMTIAFLFLTFTLLLFFGILIIPFLGTTALGYYLYMAFCAIFASGLTYLYFSGKLSRIPKNLYVLGIGTLIGAFMGIAMPLWTTIVLLIGVSVWDYISVKKGPIKGIMELMGHVDPDEVRNLTKEDFDQAEIQIGIGDVAFYSMLTSGCLIASGKNLITGIQLTVLGSIITTFFATTGILIGAFITIRALRKNTILPGLPLSIFIGLALALLSYVVLINIDFFKIILT